MPISCIALLSVRQVVQDLHSFGVRMKHIGQTTQTVLKHLVGIEGVKVPSEPSNKRMILESNLLAKLDRRKHIKSWIKYLEALATIFTKKVYVLEIGK